MAQITGPGEWWPGGPTVAMELAPDGGEESIISVSAFERLSDAAKAKYIASRPVSSQSLQSMSPPPHGEISASPRSRAPASESPPFELRKNWLSQQVQGYGTTLQDNGVTTTVAYDTDEHLRRKEPRVLSAASRTKSPTVHPSYVPCTVPLVSNDAPASPEAVRSALEQALALELETCPKFIQRMNFLPHAALNGRTPASILYPDHSLPFKYFLPFGCKATVL